MDEGNVHVHSYVYIEIELMRGLWYCLDLLLEAFLCIEKFPECKRNVAVKLLTYVVGSYLVTRKTSSTLQYFKTSKHDLKHHL